MVLKNYLYEEAEKVPLIVSWPGRIPEGKQDKAHLVSGLDIAPTMCDYAGIKPPQGVLGRSLKPILEGNTVEWREFVTAEVQKIGRMLRTPNYKYVTYSGDPVEQLFDMKADPGETKNLAGMSHYDGILEDHRKLLREWEESLDIAPETS
jgi:choline-sulfatase